VVVCLPIDSSVVEDVGEGKQVVRVPASDCSELKAQRPKAPKAPGSFRHTHAADAHKLGLARAEIGVVAGWVDTAQLKTDPLPVARQGRRSNTASSQGCQGARACPATTTDYYCT
jgi:hypothetical protein